MATVRELTTDSVTTIRDLEPPAATPSVRRRKPIAFDAFLLDARPRPELTGVRRALHEFLWFGMKNARACLFAGLFFLAVFAVPRGGVLGVPRYDLLLVIALIIQGAML